MIVRGLNGAIAASAIGKSGLVQEASRATGLPVYFLVAIPYVRKSCWKGSIWTFRCAAAFENGGVPQARPAVLFRVRRTTVEAAETRNGVLEPTA